jgi:hypothetical protein
MDSQNEYEPPHEDDGGGKPRSIEEQNRLNEPDEDIICPPTNNICRQCQAPGCTQVARYGKINDDTGEFERSHCKEHKKDGESGRPPHWKNRRNNAITIYLDKGFGITVNEETWKKECSGYMYKPSCACLKCGMVIENPPTIDKMISRGYLCDNCVDIERKREQNGRPQIQRVTCDGSCGKENCNKSFSMESKPYKTQRSTT